MCKTIMGNKFLSAQNGIIYPEMQKKKQTKVKNFFWKVKKKFARIFFIQKWKLHKIAWVAQKSCLCLGAGRGILEWTYNWTDAHSRREIISRSLQRKARLKISQKLDTFLARRPCFRMSLLDLTRDKNCQHWPLAVRISDCPYWDFGLSGRYLYSLLGIPTKLDCQVQVSKIGLILDWGPVGLPQL